MYFAYKRSTCVTFRLKKNLKMILVKISIKLFYTQPDSYVSRSKEVDVQDRANALLYADEGPYLKKKKVGGEFREKDTESGSKGQRGKDEASPHTLGQLSGHILSNTACCSITLSRP